MNIEHYFSLPTKNLLATLESGSVTQNWLAHIESSVFWIHNYTDNQQQCLQGLVKLKPKLCSESLYGDYLNVVTQSNPGVNEEHNSQEKAKRPTLKNRWHSPKKAVQNNSQTNSAKFQAKKFTSDIANSSSKPKTSKLTYLPKSLKPTVAVNKLQKWTAEQNFPATLPEPKKQHQYFASKHQKAESGLLNTKHKYSKKKFRVPLKDTKNSGNNWFQDINHRVSNTLHNNKQEHDLAQLLAKDKRKYHLVNIASNDISNQEQTITYGKRASYDLLAEQSGLFEDITTVTTPTQANNEISEGENTYSAKESSIPGIDKSNSKEQVFYQKLNKDLKQQPIIPTQNNTRVQTHQDILADASGLPHPVLQNDTNPEQLLSRLIATEENRTPAQLPTKTEQQSTNREKQVTTIKHPQEQLADSDLPELASRVKRILDEQARRHGIDV